MTAYTSLHTRFDRIGKLRAVAGMLGWDMAVMMPTGSAEARGAQYAALEVTIHEKLTDPALADLLAGAEGDNALSPQERANLAEIRRNWLHATAVPADLVEASAIVNADCEMTWRQARADNDYAGLKPKLQKVLDLVRETAQAKAEKFGCSLYDALLDQYEPGGKAEDIDKLFGDLASFLPDYIQRAIDKQATRPAALLPDGPFPIDKQKALGEKFMHALGFDFTRGRLDVSTHPFCGGAPGDVRITTRYGTDSFFESMMGVLHETGHALYELGLPADWRDQPAGQARGMSLHESQSLLIEMQACRSAEFFQFAAPLAAEIFGGSGPAWTAENLHRRALTVERGLIRVNADEVTYPAHVILRYRLERAMIAGDLSLDDLPGAWNDGMQELVGVVPPSDKDGCMQDIHWPMGAWGYFPTYTMGAMTAAQLFQAAKLAVPEIPVEIAKGNFAPLLGWLRTNIHGKGSFASTADIVTAATGKPLGVDAFRTHLETRYLA
ncbi:carboxypeptidase M32 [Lacibacterium aquatile]|uniref:Metal-dependent carboxypeptidase n=1 Tax=Lacibacterium aquatile TaxID=1168082 RepID=A0ABW5DTG4_9PROT